MIVGSDTNTCSSSSSTLSESDAVHVSASASATASPSSTLPSSPSGKRTRDPEDEVYLDNLHSHKRYLSEIMASSLNGLSVGDPLPENLMDSPARSDGMFYLREEVYSPMSEDLDECRCYENNGESQPSSPVSPYRFQRVAPAARQRGGSESEGRFPSSPSDICHSADLRRAALLRSVQMRSHFDVSMQEPYIKTFVHEIDHDKSCRPSDDDPTD